MAHRPAETAMMTRVHNRFAWVVLAGCALLAGGGRAAAAEGEIKRLREEQIAALTDAVRWATEMYQSGRGTFDEVETASRLLLAARLEAAATGAERVALLEAALEVAKSQEAGAARRHAAGLGTMLEQARAKAGRIQVQIELLKERDKLGTK